MRKTLSSILVSIFSLFCIANSVFASDEERKSIEEQKFPSMEMQQENQKNMPVMPPKPPFPPMPYFPQNGEKQGDDMRQAMPPMNQAQTLPQSTASQASDAGQIKCGYKPVCAEVQVQCIKAPCNPIQKTFPNECLAKLNNVKILSEGACAGDVLPNAEKRNDGEAMPSVPTSYDMKDAMMKNSQSMDQMKKAADANGDGVVDESEKANLMDQMKQNQGKMQQGQSSTPISAETFDPDMNHDGMVDDFESKVDSCLKENNMNMPLCQRQVKQAMMQSFTQGNIQSIDPASLNYVTPQQIDPSIFQKQNKAFFQKMDPNILNKMDTSKIPDNALQNIDPTKFQNIDPELLQKLQQKAPEKAKMIPEDVRKKSELMMDSIPEDLLKQYGFEGDQAEKVKQLMQAVDKQRREQVMQSMDNVSSENRNQMMQHQNQFEDQVSGFMEYLPFVPKNLQDQYLQAKNNMLEGANKLKEAAGTLGQKLQKDVDSFAVDVSSYNFSGTSAEELKKQIDEFVAIIPTLSEAETKVKLKAFHEQLGALKEEARQVKFTQGIIPFKDTDDDQWYTSFVSEAAKEGSIGGYKNAQGQSLGEFRPTNNVTVAEALKMALSSAGVKESTEEPSNTQAKNHWAKGWIKAAEDQGVSLANVDDINRPATRAELVEWILEAYAVTPPKATSSSFSDVVTGYPGLDYIEYAKTNGIISGDGDTGKFRPNDTIIRAEVAKILKSAKAAFGK